MSNTSVLVGVYRLKTDYLQITHLDYFKSRQVAHG
jgi:hypothetical protein